MYLPHRSHLDHLLEGQGRVAARLRARGERGREGGTGPYTPRVPGGLGRKDGVCTYRHRLKVKFPAGPRK